MIRCVNENCKKDPMNSMGKVLANIDGDFACCPACLEEYKKQRDEFFANIGNDNWYANWWNR